VVSGVIIGYREAVASNLDIPTYRVVIEPIGPPPFDQKDVTNAQVSPVGERRAGGEPSEWVYFSAPVAVEPDGTWETEVFIPAEDEREVNVYMAACSWRSLMGVTGSGEPPPSRTSEEPTLVVNQVISGKLHSSLRTK
jgi:hypothetical protein